MINPRARGESGEKGAALIVVLLLVATLSFILLSITNVVTTATKRSAADRARTDFYWRAAAGELIARQILEKYVATTPLKMAPGASTSTVWSPAPRADSTKIPRRSTRWSTC